MAKNARQRDITEGRLKAGIVSAEGLKKGRVTAPQKKQTRGVREYIIFIEQFLSHMEHFPHFIGEEQKALGFRLAVERISYLESSSARDIKRWILSRKGELAILKVMLTKHKEYLEQVSREEEGILEQQPPRNLEELVSLIKDIKNYLHVIFAILNKLLQSIEGYENILDELDRNNVTGMEMQTEFGRLENEKLKHHFRSNDWLKSEITRRIEQEEGELNTIFEKVKRAQRLLAAARSAGRR